MFEKVFAAILLSSISFRIATCVSCKFLGCVNQAKGEGEISIPTVTTTMLPMLITEVPHDVPVISDENDDPLELNPNRLETVPKCVAIAIAKDVFVTYDMCLPNDKVQRSVKILHPTKEQNIIDFGTEELIKFDYLHKDNEKNTRRPGNYLIMLKVSMPLEIPPLEFTKEDMGKRRRGFTFVPDPSNGNRLKATNILKVVSNDPCFRAFTKQGLFHGSDMFCAEGTQWPNALGTPFFEVSEETGSPILRGLFIGSVKVKHGVELGGFVGIKSFHEQVAFKRGLSLQPQDDGASTSTAHSDKGKGTQL